MDASLGVGSTVEDFTADFTNLRMIIKVKKPAVSRRVFLALYAFGSRSNIDDSETFRALQISKRRAALTRLTPFSYF